MSGGSLSQNKMSGYMHYKNIKGNICGGYVPECA